MFEKIKDFRLLIIIAIVAIGFGGFVLTSQNNADNNKQPTALSMTSIKNDMSKGSQLIDVRTSDEYSAGHIDGSINLSLQDIEAGKYPSASKDKIIYLYCRSGNRSDQAKSLLESAGYKKVKDLGAMTHVQSLGGIVKKS